MTSVLNTIDTGHEDLIHCAEVDYYGLRLATCSSGEFFCRAISLHVKIQNFLNFQTILSRYLT
jgi:hypothetical protein